MTEELPPPPRPKQGLTATGVWSAVGGVFATIPLSFLLIFGIQAALPQVAGAIIFAALVFLGGGALCLIKSAGARGFAVGLMIGWSALSILTAGLCTGLSNLHGA